MTARFVPRRAPAPMESGRPVRRTESGLYRVRVASASLRAQRALERHGGLYLPEKRVAYLPAGATMVRVGLEDGAPVWEVLWRAVIGYVRMFYHERGSRLRHRRDGGGHE